MARDKLGKIRRSQVVSTYGPGAIIDFRAGGHGGAPISVVAAGLDEWDNLSLTPGLNNDQCIEEPRLQKQLNVAGFRLPPVGSEITGKKPNEKKQGRRLSGIRFPAWLQCPRCELLQPAREWREEPGDPALYCGSCSSRSESGRPVHVVPVRFVLACESGHLDEFPWHAWVQHNAGCGRKKPLKLQSNGAGLRGLIVSCTGCGASKSMDGAFSSASMKRLKVTCSGKRPWLPGPPETCQQSNPPVVVQRGASNLYFPAIASAISIPPWNDEFQTSLGHHWHALVSATTPENVNLIIELVVYPVWDGEPMSLEHMKARIWERLELLRAPDRQDIRSEEYRQLAMGEATRGEEAEFSIRPEIVPTSLSGVLDRIVRVVRLREVRACYGFTRIYPPSGEFGTDSGCAPLSAAAKKWLPAIEVRGEGIFLTLNEKMLREWEREDGPAAARAAIVNAQWRQAWKERMGDEAEPPSVIQPRLMLIHSFSHALMRQLSLECGYSTSSLRERLYADTTLPGMCGVLIYTSTADADGTLGGLVRQGKPQRMERLVIDAIRSMEWCSSDPLCVKGFSSLSEGSNLAACHSCILAPETACEHFNRFLDRAMLVGTPDDPQLGFFSSLLTRGDS
ncbi:DUF1998 domain-containing protein [Sandaracinobacteroides hominis]|uniref:DUF1998 domain-containing protein n=1 Tax=Sandaracinobacteroides hominis TaxID=2780086 RepID=UPI0018F4C441|nr:DUF1998 domain-containing protein [Sandaracinobacteroides hominis]